MVQLTEKAVGKVQEILNSQEPKPAVPASSTAKLARPSDAESSAPASAPSAAARPTACCFSVSASFASRPAPCDHTQDIALMQAVALPAGHLALLCDGNPGFSKAVKTVYTSADTGKTDTFAGQMGLFLRYLQTGREENYLLLIFLSVVVIVLVRFVR